MLDKNLEDFLYKISTTHNDMMTECEVVKVLGFNRTYFSRVRKNNPLIPFLKIGARILYLKKDVIEYIKTTRKIG